MKAVGIRRDAAQNRAKLIAAARVAFSRADSDPSLEAIAGAAGVGIATLYRHFPHREDLVGAVFEQILDAEFAQLVDGVPPGDEAAALRDVIESALSLVARERGLLAAVGTFDSVIDRLVRAFRPRVGVLLARAQNAGQIRADLTELDIVPIVVMLMSTVAAAPLESDAWRRYLALVFDALTTTNPTVLPEGDALDPTAPSRIPFR